MHLNAYLTFEGQCEEAFRLYEAVLGGKISYLMRFEEAPDGYEAPDGWGQKVMHTCLTVGTTYLMGSDYPPGHSEKPQGFTISVQVDEPAEAERVFNALAEGGTVSEPLGETFWALKFGMLVDRFGIPWMVNCSRPE